MLISNEFIEEAFNQSLKCKKTNDVPVGCVITDKHNKIISKARNEVYKKNNICKHAEMLAIESASKRVNSRLLIDCSIYVTLEPCPMCAYAICLARIKNIYIGVLDKKTGGIISNIQMFESKVSNHKPNIYYGFMEDEISKLLKQFFLDKR